MNREENIEYLHHALGSRGIGLTGISRERVERWVDKHGFINLIDSMRIYIQEEGKAINIVVPYSNLILGFNFTGINKRNVNQFKVNIINFLVCGENIYLSQLKGNRLKGFITSPYVNDLLTLVKQYSDQKDLVEKEQDSMNIKME